MQYEKSLSCCAQTLKDAAGGVLATGIPVVFTIKNGYALVPTTVYTSSGVASIDVYALITGMDLAPLTLKEAQLMEKPVVATDVGGVGEMMSDKITGFLVKEGDYNDIIDKLTILLRDKEIATIMGKEGRKFVEDTFSWKKIAENFLKNIQPYIK